ncbi:MAG: bifunctional riboflavin kinase/FAD synthetase [Chromatiales bacterium]|jgi:riboflavin kinase/FMN adenylyltransferase|nr:bifunctional riboflavin kinase/FAD synthetase [Chromatiales bacterium]
MQVFRRPRPGVNAVLPGCVATIGVFDGFHLGHQRILDRVRSEALRLKLPALVFSFEPTPQEAMHPEQAPARLMPFRDKVSYLQASGIDSFFCPPFDHDLRHCLPGEFIERLLVRTLAVRHLVIGDDFRFGQGRAGNIDDLKAGGRRYGFDVEQVGSVIQNGVRVSSTAVRAALAAGNLAHARELLGRNYRMSGRVVAGRQLGRQLGFPTANIRLQRHQSPLAGIFAVRVHGLGPQPLDAVASLGTRPTVAGVEPLLEVHVFDFDADIYRRRIDVEFVAHLRNEERFADLEALRRQMECDAAEARRLLTGTPM